MEIPTVAAGPQLKVAAFEDSILKNHHELPVFDTREEERTWAKKQMAGALRVFAKLGYCDGNAGHVSLRGQSET